MGIYQESPDSRNGRIARSAERFDHVYIYDAHPYEISANGMVYFGQNPAPYPQEQVFSTWGGETLAAH